MNEMNVVNLPCMTELEERLASAEGERCKAAVMAELTALEQRLARQMNELLPKEQFAEAQVAHRAVQVALAVLPRWATGSAASPTP